MCFSQKCMYSSHQCVDISHRVLAGESSSYMKSSTARRPPNPRQTRPNKSRKYVKQTARFEGKRDGKPLIFGWGGHLSHNQKVQLQRRATWITATSLFVLIVVVLAGFWININIITPGLAITSVNGHGIPQSLFRKMVAFQAELAQNNLNGPHGLTAQRDSLRKQVAEQQQTVINTNNQITSLNNQVKALPAGPSAKRTALEKQLTDAKTQLNTQQAKLAALNQQYTTLTQTTIAQAQTNYNQPQVANDSITWLHDDEHAMVTIKLRRENMQSYLASLAVSPAYQVLARTMTIDTKAHAQKILDQLKHGGDFGKLAKANSADTGTSSKGGDLGWMARGQYAQTYGAAVVENWMFDSSRKLDELSPILNENGAYHIVQIMGIDPSRSVDSAVLQQLKTNALSNWLDEQHALPTTKL